MQTFQRYTCGTQMLDEELGTDRDVKFSLLFETVTTVQHGHPSFCSTSSTGKLRIGPDISTSVELQRKLILR